MIKTTRAVVLFISIRPPMSAQMQPDKWSILLTNQ